MKNFCHVAIAIPTIAVCATLLWVPPSGRGQAPTPADADREQALRAKRLAEQFERNARVLTILDSQGKVVSTVGEPGIYSDPVFSPDRTRLAVIKSDQGNQESGTSDLWVLDAATGKGTRITSNPRREWAWTPAWSPDGTQLAYVALRAGYTGLYRKASDGTGSEDLLYQHPGAGLSLTDWSMDGRFLAFSLTDLSGGTLYVLPLAGDGERKPIEVFRSDAQLQGSRLSPDSRFLAYTSNHLGQKEVYVRPFGGGPAPAVDPWQVSDQGALFGQVAVSGQGGEAPVFWRRDGRELYYLAADRGVMAVEVSTAPTFKFGKPKLLFRLPEAFLVTPWRASVSRDGQRIVVAVPRMPMLQQITVFDRQGEVLSKVGEPGLYRAPSLSPDGNKVAVVRTMPQTSNTDIWTFDVASGQGRPLTNDPFQDRTPVWSQESTQVAYVSRRESFDSIYRKASDGTGAAEQLFQSTPGASIILTDSSADGRFLTFHDGCDGVLNVVPLIASQKPPERQPIEWLRDEYNVAQARFSPDGRFMAYLSNEGKSNEEINSNIFEVYVRPFDPAKSDVSAGSEKPVQVSTTGALGMIFWREDGKEIYYFTPDWEVMAVDVTTTPTFRAGAPRLLFKLTGLSLTAPEEWKNVSADGQRFVFTINVPVSISAR
jgi:Tol biopolymer transport system component